MSDLEKELQFQKLRVEALEAELSKKEGKGKSKGASDSKGPPLRRHHSII
jgi:hypothetical protein